MKQKILVLLSVVFLATSISTMFAQVNTAVTRIYGGSNETVTVTPTGGSPVLYPYNSSSDITNYFSPSYTSFHIQYGDLAYAFNTSGSFPSISPTTTAGRRVTVYKESATHFRFKAEKFIMGLWWPS